MTSVIRVLDDLTINKIAAGEVIENAASVVKELVDNALDAKASEISVDLAGGGRQLIRVTDNGHGMSGDDALLCFERHATSKIRSLEDVYSIGSMGFRGEALPSIASVSRVLLLSRPKDASQGCMVSIEGGKVLKQCEADMELGTTIEVKSLFYNVPVRRKFLRSPQYDANEILKVMRNLAMARPDVAFHLSHHGKTLLKTQPRSDLGVEGFRNCVSQCCGKTFVEDSLICDHSYEGYRIWGVLGGPQSHRNNRSGQYLFVNQRPVMNSLVSRAVTDAYNTLLPPRRHPVFALHLELPPDHADINVHPQKKELRFRSEHLVAEAVLKAVTSALQCKPAVPAEPISAPPPPIFWEEAPSFTEPKVEAKIEEEPAALYKNIIAQEPMMIAEQPGPELQAYVEQISVPEPRVNYCFPGFSVINITEESELLRSLGWIQEEGGLLLVDQHQAHTRVLFEQCESGSVEKQMLLVPFKITLDEDLNHSMKSMLPILEQWGFEIAPQDNSQWELQALPHFLKASQAREWIVNLLDSDDNNPEQWEEKRKAQICVRAAMSKKRTLALEEAQTLIKALAKCKTPLYSPMGKRTMRQLSVDFLDKLMLS